MLAIIPARGGSKGLPRKNVLEFAGRPLIAYTIGAARASKTIDRVIVTTDDAEIAEVARREGAEVPFMRPSELASDTAKAVDVYNHALGMVESERYRCDEFCVLLPTAPLRTAEHIDEAVALFSRGVHESVISVTSYDHPIYWALSLGEDRSITPLFPDVLMKNRQDVPVAYRPNGAIYVFLRSFFALNKGYYGPRSLGYVMKPDESIDIDTLADFRLAEMLFMNKAGDRRRS